MGHTVYAPNDIPLLDNRFRIDPETDQITFIFHHSKGYQRVVLVQPNGHKIYQQRHGNNVNWTSSATQNIVTVQKPMAGPWQAIAELDGDNRIKLISKVHLEVNRLPLKLYAQEYITTNVALYEGKKLLKNPAYLADAKLSISLIGSVNKKVALYQDDGKNYDQLAFDGQLTSRFYVDLQPGRYLLSIRTRNEVFIRNVNKDAVVFPIPIRYQVAPLEGESDKVKITFIIDDTEIVPTSVSIDGLIKDQQGTVATQVIMHNMDNTPKIKQFSSTYPLPYKLYTFSGKAYATTRDGREIELQLPDKLFELVAPFIMPEINTDNTLIAQPEKTIETEIVNDEQISTSLFSNLWMIIAIIAILLVIIGATVLFIFKRKNKKHQIVDASLDELNLDELQPIPIELEDAK